MLDPEKLGEVEVRCVARTVRNLDDAGPTLRAGDVLTALALRARPPLGAGDD